MNHFLDKKTKIIKWAKNKLVRFRLFFKDWRQYFKKRQQKNLNKNLVYSLATSNIPNQKQLYYIKRLLSRREKIIILICLILLGINLIYLGHRLYNRYWQIFPRSGGVYTEGVLGAPRFINPLYTDERDVDADLAQLIYSSLFKHDPNGLLVPDLVLDWKISENNLEYIINLKDGVNWHGNGGRLTAEDVLFTFDLMKNPNFRSPWHRRLTGVEMEKISDLSIKITLSEPHAPLLELLTFGILPKFAWGRTTPDAILLADLNLKPIGSGPFQFKSLLRSRDGEIKEYRLVVNENYYGRRPYLDEIVFKFYFDFESLIQALNDKQVDGIAYLPPYLKESILARNSLFFRRLALPQISALFFNQTKYEILKNKDLRQALAISLNRDQLINEALFGFGDRSDGPLPISNQAYNHQLTPLPYDVEAARALLIKAGWLEVDFSGLSDSQEDQTLKNIILSAAAANNLDSAGIWRLSSGTNRQPLIINLSTPNTPEDLALADLIKLSWEKLGIRTTIKPLDAQQIQTEIINDKNFQILLQRQVIGSDPDVSVFWHSAQAEVGLNLINYHNSEVDSLLLAARQLVNDPLARINKYHLFQQALAADLPAIFLYSPVYLYVQDWRLKGFTGTAIIKPQDRFSSISDWYVRTTRRFIP